MNSFATYVRNKNQKTEEAFQAIEEAKRILSDLEKVALSSAQGGVPDIARTAELTHALRGSVDRILVGLVEAAIVPSKVPVEPAPHPYEFFEKLEGHLPNITGVPK